MSEQPERCECGGYYSHVSTCPKYKTPKQQHEDWLKEKQKKEQNEKNNRTFTSANNAVVRVEAI